MGQEAIVVGVKFEEHLANLVGVCGFRMQVGDEGAHARLERSHSGERSEVCADVELSVIS